MISKLRDSSLPILFEQFIFALAFVGAIIIVLHFTGFTIYPCLVEIAIFGGLAFLTGSIQGLAEGIGLTMKRLEQTQEKE